jgi:putative tryptophan/tyrosine transport system substrate-binding protein
MTRRTVGLLVIFALGLLVAPLAVDAQPPVKVPLLGILGTGLYSSETEHQQAPLWDGLHELGWDEGQNIAVERRDAEGQLDRLPALAIDLVQRRPDVIVTYGTLATRAAQHATRTIPIVVATAADLVGQGLVASLARPGGNLTGLELADAQLVGKRFELLKAAAPAISRVAVLSNPANPAYDRLLSEAPGQAHALGLQLQRVEARAPDAFDAAFTAMAARQAEALMITDDAMLLLHRHRLLGLAIRHRLPTVAGVREFAEAGGLLAYGRSLPAMYRRAATYVDKILRGANPGDLPVERLHEYELVINLKTAQALGLTIPPSLLFQADEVIR